MHRFNVPKEFWQEKDAHHFRLGGLSFCGSETPSLCSYRAPIKTVFTETIVQQASYKAWSDGYFPEASAEKAH